MSKNVMIGYFRTIIHVAVSFQVGRRRLLTVNPGRKITMSSLLPGDRNGLFKCTLMFTRFYVLIMVKIHTSLLTVNTEVWYSMHKVCVHMENGAKHVLMQWCMGHFFPNVNQFEDNSQLNYIVIYVSFVSNSILLSSYLFSSCTFRLLN